MTMKYILEKFKEYKIINKKKNRNCLYFNIWNTGKNSIFFKQKYKLGYNVTGTL